MASEETPLPACFGVMEQVFPETANGLRASPERCFACGHKTACMRAALRKPDGILLRQAQMDRAVQAGLVGFWKRWSQKKYLARVYSESQKEHNKERA